ncbi:hypothetical protein OWR29_11010 [Actinoplanes sp. Pm04-4]|uniref:Integral membrane protein n=1 Tax=Paractinoplanes pyxinae TaxID=2997416 RepID=A0ABT4AWC0_9ACTN|nr:hypothetical protein [Actinoplanes pyxinae]MCY1138528.1 hypothetical protein [Actinoplanes pyxinae]
MGAVDRLARAAVLVAARRWPDDLAGVMRDEWLAELAVIGEPWRKLAFAGSLAVSPGVDEPSWRERAENAGRLAAVAAGVTLLAAVATNLARATEALAPVMLLLGAAGLALAGRRVRGSVALAGVALFAFLFAGNPVPMMPFMGARDIAPAVAVWTIGMAVALRARRRWVAVAGGLVTLDLAVVAGSAHAAAALGVPAWTAPAWFPLALLPGGTVSFGPHLGDGPAFHASGILLANAAVSAGPFLLCTAFLLASALTGKTGEPARSSGHLTRRVTDAARAAVSRLGVNARRGAAGAVTALATLAVAPALPAAGGDPDVVLRRLLDNSTAFGFGFVEHPVGLGAVALLAALLAMRATDSLTAA